ncbi:NAC domain-containing protein 83-like [Punica granatum]|uniref:NAC domain-containing protein n=2 Tax=Punica granatum TaxID=22663 RepID=A0A218XXV8_PUNGR|nr:NAC domain-containing protein 83-like [Punica granatum]OWM89804.1 hypothetical protein CDL15_Pgr024552 [Punica granatum]PKI57854.1 hypothetical protein CRG98_021757 [Punica granatum]
MDNNNKVGFVRNGVLRLPPGFRFHPTDEELVVQYLRRKALSCPLPASIIPEVDVCKSDPWDLPGDGEQERYFFSTREAKYPNGNRSNRATVSGYWKATGIDRQIVTSKGNQLVGMKKTLVFYRGKPPNGSKTDWIMHEYRLVVSDGTSPRNAHLKMNLNQSPEAPIENWVLCRIFLKRRSSTNLKNEDVKTEVHEDEEVRKARKNGKPVYYEFFTRKDRTRTDLNLVPCSSSSGSSGLTNISSNHKNKGLEDHEESSSCNSFNFQCFVTKP